MHIYDINATSGQPGDRLAAAVAGWLGGWLWLDGCGWMAVVGWLWLSGCGLGSCGWVAEARVAEAGWLWLGWMWLGGCGWAAVAGCVWQRGYGWAVTPLGPPPPSL